MGLESWVALGIKPVAYIVLLLLVVYPLMWLLAKVIPEGRIKTALFRKRDLLAESMERTERLEQRLRESKRADPSQAKRQP